MKNNLPYIQSKLISDAVKMRHRDHIRDDADHSSSAIIDKCINIHKKEYHQSANNKSINE